MEEYCGKANFGKKQAFIDYCYRVGLNRSVQLVICGLHSGGTGFELGNGYRVS